jgi:excinuclease ABC subunit A
MDKPDVDYIEGLSPFNFHRSKTTSNNPRSTVGTVTEIYIICACFLPGGQTTLSALPSADPRQTVDQVVDTVMALPEGSKIKVLAPIIKAQKANIAKSLTDFLKMVLLD